jgi:hypothetical protein
MKKAVSDALMAYRFVKEICFSMRDLSVSRRTEAAAESELSNGVSSKNQPALPVAD